VALVLAETGSLSAFALGDGKGVGAAPGPFDPAIRPVADGARAIVASLGGGAVELDVKSGKTLRSWAWTGSTSFLAADRDRVYSGLDGLAGRGIFFASRAGEPVGKLLPLASGAFASPIAVSGARGGLLLLLMDGSLVLVGKDMEPNSAASALDASITPKAETVSAIATALGRFKPGDTIAASQPVMELETDKAVIEVPSATGGVVREINEANLSGDFLPSFGLLVEGEDEEDPDEPETLSVTCTYTFPIPPAFSENKEALKQVVHCILGHFVFQSQSWVEQAIHAVSEVVLQ